MITWLQRPFLNVHITSWLDQWDGERYQMNRHISPTACVVLPRTFIFILQEPKQQLQNYAWIGRSSELQQCKVAFKNAKKLWRPPELQDRPMWTNGTLPQCCMWSYVKTNAGSHIRQKFCWIGATETNSIQTQQWVRICSLTHQLRMSYHEKKKKSFKYIDSHVETCHFLLFRFTA